jgi:hypothetical protein
MMAGSDTENGRANSLTESPGSVSSLASSARRVGSDSAAKVRSSSASENLTIGLSIAQWLLVVKDSSSVWAAGPSRC